VTLPRFLADSVTGGRVVLLGAEARHAAVVRRISPGEWVELTDGDGGVVAGTVTVATPDRLEVAVARRWAEPAPQPRLLVAQALAKGDRAEAAVAVLTEVGVDEVLPWAASRCVVQWRGERGAKALSRWRVTAREAAKQSRRAWLPAVAEPVGTQALAALARTAALAVVLHEEAVEPLAALRWPESGDVLLVVGPEGGITAEETEALGRAGARVCRLGDTVLRTSTAGAVAAAVVLAATRWR
jgi:16S rRNA (uracil1498-N3)-methyltransferase